MSNYNTILQSNNTDLQNILNTINALPDAGGSGVETCTVTISNYAEVGNQDVKYVYSNQFMTSVCPLNNSITFECNAPSIITIGKFTNSGFALGTIAIAGDATELDVDGDGRYGTFLIEGNCTIDLQSEWGI